ncbi:MAG: hypothetical protein A3J24_02475 [Deltaproteobacteria bacterium RIFCSPLOWO2_02_FULL_53_8]|nr:MAG: hypothetical protein A3J24_02475 [Deltaproteobacteria bacterium RIFCSPLOWO2_02_FULL_53_8]
MITKDSKNIFIADDSVFFRTKLSDVFVEAGHKVRFAKDGKELIKEISIDHDAIDLLILDLQMPDIDGYGVLKWLKENGYTDKFPVLVVTAVYEAAGIVERLRELGAAGLMTKGFTPEQIIFRVNKILFPDKCAYRDIAERVPVSIPVDFTLGEAKTRTGYLLNISDGGTFLHTAEELLLGAMLHLRFSLPGTGRVFALKAAVKWSTNDVAHRTLFGGYGLSFTGLTDDEKGVLKSFVAEEMSKLAFEKT